MDPTRTARSWTRPYTSVQWAWVRALGVEPSASWRDGELTKRRRHGSAELREAMRQRHGVRGL